MKRIRLLIPRGREWHGNGHEPLDYKIQFLDGTEKVAEISVMDGKHPKSTVHSGDPRTQWITFDARIPKRVTAVVFTFYRTSGINSGTVVFEFEVIGIEQVQ